MRWIICCLLIAVGQHGMAAEKGATREMCGKAISEAKDSLQTYRGTLKKNLEGGYITRANYKQAMSGFKSVESLLTSSKCMSSTGRDLQIYRCLAGSYGDIMSCIKP